MPTKTFFNLPLEKRQRLLDAIYEEFTRVPFDKVSINRIIRTAEIPRGSFYQYFEDKQDVLQYLLSDYRLMLKRYILDSLKQSGGDLFQLFLNAFDFTYAFIGKEKHNAFFKQLFSDIRVNIEYLLKRANHHTFGELIEELRPFIDMRSLDIRGRRDFDHMLSILLLLTGEAFTKAFFDLSEYQHIRDDYAARLVLLKRGFSKEKQRGL